MPSFAPVRSVLRALDLLYLLGHTRGASVGILHEQSGLPKATVVRLLETLIEAGYVWKDPHQNIYLISEKVYRLSGFHNAPLIIQAARPYALDLSQRFKWPASVAVLDHDAMIILYSTMTESPISWTPSGQRLPLLTRALGKAYIAFSSPEQQRLILNLLRKSDNPENALAKQPKPLQQMLREIREMGFAERDPRFGPSRQTTIAVPINVNGEPIGTLGLTYFVLAMPREEAIDIYSEALTHAAAAIGKDVERRLPGATRRTTRGRRGTG